MMGLKIKEAIIEEGLPGHVACLLEKQLKEQVLAYKEMRLKLDTNEIDFMDFGAVNEIKKTESRIKVLCNKLNKNYKEYIKIQRKYDNRL